MFRLLRFGYFPYLKTTPNHRHSLCPSTGLNPTVEGPLHWTQCEECLTNSRQHPRDQSVSGRKRWRVRANRRILTLCTRSNMYSSPLARSLPFSAFSRSIVSRTHTLNRGLSIPPISAIGPISTSGRYWPHGNGSCSSHLDACRRFGRYSSRRDGHCGIDSRKIASPKARRS